MSPHPPVARGAEYKYLALETMVAQSRAVYSTRYWLAPRPLFNPEHLNSQARPGRGNTRVGRGTGYRKGHGY